MPRAHRTYWRVRQRYRRAGFAGSIIGGFAAAGLIAPSVHSAEWSGDGVSLPMALQWLALFLGAVILPAFAARTAWRVHRRRFFGDMYRITTR